jgi:hypothetical protein
MPLYYPCLARLILTLRRLCHCASRFLTVLWRWLILFSFLVNSLALSLLFQQVYGVRVYKNGSTLVNHVDRSETHVVSCIFHLGHDLDEPWPLEIEDHDGVVHAVRI